ncbi:MAG: hypothetical protein P4M02_12460 [Clostridia bacterium]|nr:hypothetical protein [Clostridia bacterium]
MNEMEQRISTALNGAVDRIQPGPGLLEKILAAPGPAARRRPAPYRFAPIFACALLVAAAAILSPRLAGLYGRRSVPGTFASGSHTVLSASGSTTGVSSGGVTGNNSTGGVVTGGLCMFCYYRYNGYYYTLGAAEPGIQKSIEKNLYASLYQIAGTDPAKSIALFVNGYYWRLTRAFSDTVYWGGKPYLIDANSGTTPGASIGKAGGYDAYRGKGSSTNDEIVVKLADSRYSIAYQFLSSVSLNGISYELRTSKSNINGCKETYLGMAGPYKAYSCDGSDAATAIMLHINSAEEVQAQAMTPSGGALPASLYGSVFESMYPSYGSVQYKHHGIYMINGSYNSDAGQAALKKLLGDPLGQYAADHYVYPLFAMKGTDPSKAILVKNNQVYIEYDYIYPDTVTFRGAAYEIPSDDNPYDRGVRGAKIGMAGPYPVYAIKGIDPSKAIMAQMSGSTSGGGGMGATETLIRVDK